MPNVFNVAKYIIDRMNNNITTMKLEKLVYYSQAWSLAILNKPLFKNNIEAWTNGPVIPDLYELHKHEYHFSSSLLNNGKYDYNFTDNQKAVMDGVIRNYGRETGRALSKRTHREAPWLHARKNVPKGARCNNNIKWSDMKNYYSSLVK